MKKFGNLFPKSEGVYAGVLLERAKRLGEMGGGGLAITDLGLILESVKIVHLQHHARSPLSRQHHFQIVDDGDGLSKTTICLRISSRRLVCCPEAGLDVRVYLISCRSRLSSVRRSPQLSSLSDVYAPPPYCNHSAWFEITEGTANICMSVCTKSGLCPGCTPFSKSSLHTTTR